MGKTKKVIVLILLVASLVAIRLFAATIFYDPLIDFFKANHITKGLPDLNKANLILSVSLRFWLNTIVSLSVLWIIFLKKDIIKLSLILYSFFFLLLIVLFIILLNTFEKESYMMLFYVRRFLIHPIFLLLLIPAFYFQKKVK